MDQTYKHVETVQQQTIETHPCKLDNKIQPNFVQKQQEIRNPQENEMGMKMVLVSKYEWYS